MNRRAQISLSSLESLCILTETWELQKAVLTLGV